jgi:hypothetical protein
MRANQSGRPQGPAGIERLPGCLQIRRMVPLFCARMEPISGVEGWHMPAMSTGYSMGNVMKISARNMLKGTITEVTKDTRNNNCYVSGRRGVTV